MNDNPTRRLIAASSLGTPDASALRATIDDATAARVVARAEQIADQEPHHPYYCPTSHSVECCPECSGWDVCCDRPDLHRPDVGQATWPTLAEWAPHLLDQARQPELTPPTPDSIEQLRARIVPGPEQGPPAALARLVDAITARLDTEPPPEDGMCQAVWRDKVDGALVACALDAEPGHDWCATHQHRNREHRILIFHDRADAARVEPPPGFTDAVS